MSKSPLLSLFIATTRESLRNKMELFFNLFFPLLYLLLFGSMQGSNDGHRKIWMGVHQSGEYGVESVVGESGAWEPKVFETAEQLQEAILEGELNMGLSFDGSHVSYWYKEGDIRTQSRLKLAELSITAALERQMNQVEPSIIIRRQAETAGKVMATGREYRFAGIIAIAILSVGMMSVVSMFSRYRKNGVFNQLQIAPLRPVSFIIGITLSRVILSLVSSLIILLASVFILKVSFEINWLLLSITMICSTLGMMALGLLLNLVFRNPETTNTTAGILMFMMYFLAGVFFHVSFLPSYMQAFSSVLPLKYVATLVRHSMGIELISSGSFAIISICLALGGGIMLWIAGRKFLSSLSH